MLCERNILAKLRIVQVKDSLYQTWPYTRFFLFPIKNLSKGQEIWERSGYFKKHVGETSHVIETEVSEVLQVKGKPTEISYWIVSSDKKLSRMIVLNAKVTVLKKMNVLYLS